MRRKQKPSPILLLRKRAKKLGLFFEWDGPFGYVVYRGPGYEEVARVPRLSALADWILERESQP